jgi:hypothetical protein
MTEASKSLDDTKAKLIALQNDFREEIVERSKRFYLAADSNKLFRLTKSRLENLGGNLENDPEVKASWEALCKAAEEHQNAGEVLSAYIQRLDSEEKEASLALIAQWESMLISQIAHNEKLAVLAAGTLALSLSFMASVSHQANIQHVEFLKESWFVLVVAVVWSLLANWLMATLKGVPAEVRASMALDRISHRRLLILATMKKEDAPSKDASASSPLTESSFAKNVRETLHKFCIRVLID